MKSMYKVLLVATMLLNTSIASAAYVVTNSQTGNFTPGSVSGSIPSFTLVSSYGARPSESAPNIVTYTDTFSSDTTLSFNWSYQTADNRSTTFDKAGYVLNNAFKQLSTDGLLKPGSQSGSVLISIMANDIFGWYIDSTDSVNNSGILSIQQYSATPSEAPSAVPVPAALPLMASALLAFGISRRNKLKAKLNIKV